MDYDLGITGLGLLTVMSLAFGGIAQAIFWRVATHWMWLIGALAYFVGGLVASEIVFAWATEGDLQPLIDGLLLDESMLGGLLVGVPVVLVTWWVTRHRGAAHQPSMP
jgi:Na+/proline symporter